ncbi:MAG: hypothetical protein HQL27_01460 [Candidatus Omnitrophica bacterium]|nr:hypothetical protein [Candidatus Omnitrophota bacterium]
MSKASKQSIILLIFLLFVSIAFSGYLVFEKQKTEQDKKTIELQLEKVKKTEKEKDAQIKDANEKLLLAHEERAKFEKENAETKAKAGEWAAKMDEITKDRDKLKARIDEVSKERDDLVGKMQAMIADGGIVKEPSDGTPLSDDLKNMGVSQSDEYWASVLKEKASLQAKLDSIKEDLSKKTMEIVEVKQGNADISLEMDTLARKKDELVREIKHKEDMINNLSLELARTKNDKKYIADRIISLNQENADLRSSVKQLISTKGALEKTIVQVKEDKMKLEKRLSETDSLVQNKIDEIWAIKESLDRAFQKTSLNPTSSINLEKIVVSQNRGDVIEENKEEPTESFPLGAESALPGFNGKVVSVNEENNFAIVDIGEEAGIKMGDILSVYKGSNYTARLEVIQVRKDISAADIKEQWSKISVGDTVK